MFIDALLDSPGVELQPCGEEWPILRAKLIARGHKGNDVTDAWIASATESCSEHLVTFDRDFLNLLSPGDLTRSGDDLRKRCDIAAEVNLA